MTRAHVMGLAMVTANLAGRSALKTSMREVVIGRRYDWAVAQVPDRP